MCTFGYFFTASSQWAGRSARYDRRVRNAEAAGSNPARSIGGLTLHLTITNSKRRKYLLKLRCLTTGLTLINKSPRNNKIFHLDPPEAKRLIILKLKNEQNRQKKILK